MNFAISFWTAVRRHSRLLDGCAFSELGQDHNSAENFIRAASSRQEGKEAWTAEEGHARRADYRAARTEFPWRTIANQLGGWACYIASRVCAPFQNSGKGFWNAIADWHFLLTFGQVLIRISSLCGLHIGIRALATPKWIETSDRQRCQSIRFRAHPELRLPLQPQARHTPTTLLSSARLSAAGRTRHS